MRWCWSGAVMVIILSGCYAGDSPAYRGSTARWINRPLRARPTDLASIPTRNLQMIIPSCRQWQVIRLDSRPGTETRTGNGSLRLGQVGQGHWGMMLHRLRSGDTAYRLARTYYGEGKYQDVILRENGITKGAKSNRLFGRRWVYLPLSPLKTAGGKFRQPGRLPDYYIVGRGDTLYRIARILLGDGKRWKEILSANRGQIPAGNKLSPGMRLRIGP